MDEPCAAYLLDGGGVGPSSLQDEATKGGVVRVLRVRPHELGGGDHGVCKVSVPQQITTGLDHQRSDVVDSVTGRRRRLEQRHLRGEDRGENVVLGRVVAVQRPQRDAGLGGDLLGVDPVEFSCRAQSYGSGQDGCPPTLLLVAGRLRGRPAVTDPRHRTSIGFRWRYGDAVPISGTGRARRAVRSHDQLVSYAKYGPWAVIAGGSEGVGAEFARLLAQAQVNLVLIARKPEPLEATAAACRDLGVEVRTVAVDLTDSAAVGSVLAATDGLEVGLLVYNAGANTCSAEFLDADLTDFGRVLDLNVTTMMALVQHYGRGMRDRRRGGILLVGSMAGYLGSVRHTVYGGVKAFGRIFAEGLWLELRDYDVDVLELVLGVTRTPAMERVGLNFDVPGLRVAEPAEVAAEGLDRLPHGPVHIAGGNAEDVVRRNDPDRARVVAGTHKMMQRLLGISD